MSCAYAFSVTNDIKELQKLKLAQSSPEDAVDFCHK